MGRFTWISGLWIVLALLAILSLAWTGNVIYVPYALVAAGMAASGMAFRRRP